MWSLWQPIEGFSFRSPEPTWRAIQSFENIQQIKITINYWQVKTVTIMEYFRIQTLIWFLSECQSLVRRQPNQWTTGYLWWHNCWSEGNLQEEPWWKVHDSMHDRILTCFCMFLIIWRARTVQFQKNKNGEIKLFICNLMRPILP